MQNVSKNEFHQFLKSYPNPLTIGRTNICSPPFISYRDETIETKGKVGSLDYYFDKEVARITMECLGPNREIDNDNSGKFWEYSIKVQEKEI